MKVVVDVPKSTLVYLAKLSNAGKEPLSWGERVILNGKVLPATHGRLIDADDVKRRMIPLDFSCQNWISEVELSICPTIIEAESEEATDVRKPD